MNEVDKKGVFEGFFPYNFREILKVFLNFTQLFITN